MLRERPKKWQKDKKNKIKNQNKKYAVALIWTSLIINKSEHHVYIDPLYKLFWENFIHIFPVIYISFFFFFLFLCPWHVEVPGPGIEPAPLQWQCTAPQGNTQSLNFLLVYFSYQLLKGFCILSLSLTLQIFFFGGGFFLPFSRAASPGIWRFPG